MNGIDERDIRPVVSAGDGVGWDAAEEGRRATYGLLATLLAGPPTDETLGQLEALEGSQGRNQAGAFAAAWAGLGTAARCTAARRVAVEYHTLFIGLTQGEVVPYACWYRSGALMDRPLVRLRRDLARLGFAREAGLREPEDHAATLCAVMQVLLGERDDNEAGRFFRQHLEPWMARLFADMARAPTANFYRAVADLGARLVALDSIYWSPPGERRDQVTAMSVASRQTRNET